MHNLIDSSQIEARSKICEEGIVFGDTVAAVLNLVDAKHNTLRFYHNDKPIGDEGLVSFEREDPTKPIYFFFRLGDGENQTAELIQGTDLAP